MKTAKGLHLWAVRFGYTTFWITTRLNAPQTAVKRGQDAARENGVRDGLRSVDYKGTIDA